MSNQGVDFIEPPKSIRRRKKRKPILGVFPRIVLIVSMVGLTSFVCVSIAMAIARPFEIRNQEVADVNSTQAALTATEAGNRELTGEYQYLKSPGGMELTARQQGYVKHGEVSVVLENVPMPVAPAAPAPSFTDRIKNAWAKITGR